MNPSGRQFPAPTVTRQSDDGWARRSVSGRIENVRREHGQAGGPTPSRCGIRWESE